jgi:glycosyltransferase involved in cell wall biosynthesis
MDLTLCICSRNRAGELKRTLSRIFALRIPEGLRWEMLLIDNGSTDETLEVLESFCAPRLRCPQA